MDLFFDMIIEVMLLNTGIFFLILLVMIFFLAVNPKKKHSKNQINEDLNNIKEQINGNNEL